MSRAGKRRLEGVQMRRLQMALEVVSKRPFRRQLEPLGREGECVCEEFLTNYCRMVQPTVGSTIAKQVGLSGIAKQGVHEAERQPVSSISS